jgi:tetratricopeptide (TPR) repeat protein
MLTSISLKNKSLSQDEAVKLQVSVEAITGQTNSDIAKSVGLAALYLRNDQNDKALKTLKDAISSVCDLGDISYELGEVYENDDQLDEAKRHYMIAARLASQQLCAAKAGLARVEADPEKKKARIIEATIHFCNLKKITHEDFVPLNPGEPQYSAENLIGELISGAEFEKGEKQLLMIREDLACGNCGNNYQKVSATRCVICTNDPMCPDYP